MKQLLFLFLLNCSTSLFAQQKDCNTLSFSITGDIKQPLTIDNKALENYTAVSIADFTITNHKGEVKKTITGLKGVLLKDILSKIEITSDSPKTLSEYYFVFAGCDGYKVVYSWNEIFNNDTGNSIYVLTEKEGAAGSNIKEGMVSLTLSDKATGRRFVKGLLTITVNRVK